MNHLLRQPFTTKPLVKRRACTNSRHTRAQTSPLANQHTLCSSFLLSATCLFLSSCTEKQE